MIQTPMESLPDTPGNYSTNYQITGRELMTPDEVRMLDNRYALLFIRGERPVMDEKFDILKHTEHCSDHRRERKTLSAREK